jgi:EAL domain-containing protein (putative c-di-GMP-specific phosphodiesterase class I)
MRFFEYPYVIITILVMIFILMGLIGLYFTIKSVRTAKGSAEKSFCSMGKIENDFNKAIAAEKNCCVIYISTSLNNMERVYSESKAQRTYELIKNILFNHFGVKISGEISLYGKESFVAINCLPDDDVISGIEDCYNEINDVFVNHGAVGIARVSFGYLLTGSTEVSFKTALSRAKQACSMAEDKRVLYCRWDLLNGKEFERKISIENNIENEIDNNRFFLEYQPILDAKTGDIIGAEVLSRLNSPTEGILTPRFFLSAVNNVGLNQKFDYYIFEKSCKWIAGNKDNRIKKVYTINFSRFTLCDPYLAENIIRIVEKYDISYSCIAIEILEDKNLNSNEKAFMTNNLAILKRKGVLILIDDFGKGYAQYGDLTQFDISIVKIDKSITQNAVSEKGFTILESIISTAHNLGFKTICEGIETEEHRKQVIKAGCDMVQGYYFYRPMPVTQFETLFEKP